LLLIYQSTLLGQTILTSFPIDLNKSKEYNQILNIENESTHEVFVFIKDREKITILKFNRALFLNSQFTFPLENLDNKLLLGCSFSEDGNPTLYLSSSNLKKITPFNDISSIKYYLDKKTYEILNFKFPDTEFAVTTFQMNNSFHILAQNRIMQVLIVYTFQDSKALKKVFSFESLIVQDKNGHAQTFNTLTNLYPIEKMEVDDYNPLDKSSQKSKVYIQKNHIILTLDYNPKNTQAFDINIENLDLSEKNFPQSVLQDSKKRSNSFYHDEKLYQVNASESELLLDIKDFNSGKILKNISVLKEGDKKSKNTPLFIQKDSRKPKEVKNPKRFLQHLYNLDISLSVFNNKQNTYISVGGTPSIKDKEKFFKTNLSYRKSRENNTFSDLDFPPIYHSECVFFERILDQNFEFVTLDETPLALDKLSYFLNKNKKTTLSSSFKFKDYYILGYYDVKKKQYIMRKFTDGFN